MKLSMKRILSFLIILAILISVLSANVYAGSDQPSTYLTSSNSGTRHVVCTSLDNTRVGNYYTGSYTFDNLSSMSSSNLLTSLRKLMTDTHTYKTVYASHCRDMANVSDCENNDGRINLIYTSVSVTRSDYINDRSNGWNREHVWPQSLGGFKTSGAGSDMHHVRPSDSKINNTRGDDLYGNVSSGSSATGTDLVGYMSGGTSGGGYFEPLDNVKGDVARICLYVYVRYGGELNECSSITNVFKDVDTLLEWCKMDPVDTWEMGRNVVVGNIQGNRNVFIDYPELAWKLFGRSVPSDMQTPSGFAMNGTAGGDNGSGDGTGGDTGDNSGAGSGSGSGSGSTEIPDYTATDISELLTIGGALANKATTSEWYYAEGTISEAPYSNFGNTTITDENGNSIKVWGLYSSDGSTRYDAMATKPVLGDKVVLYAPVYNYNGTVELLDARLIAILPDCTHENTELRGYLAPSCKAAGYSGDTYCTDCEEKLSTGTPIPKDEKGHSTVLKNAVAATCQSVGYSGDKFCTICEKTVEAGEDTPINKNSHTWDEWVITKPATESASGRKKHTCTGCGVSEIAIVLWDGTATPDTPPSTDVPPSIDENPGNGENGGEIGEPPAEPSGDNTALVVTLVAVSTVGGGAAIGVPLFFLFRKRRMF